MDKELQKRKVVVTGATGMVGSHLVARLLLSGYRDITIFVRTVESVRKLENILTKYGISGQLKDIKTEQISLYNVKSLTDRLKGVDVVFHCAAKVSFQQKASQALIKENVFVAYAVAESCYRANVGLLVHVSSIASLDLVSPPEKITEANILQSLNGKSAYAVSKFFAENEVWRVGNKGLRIVVANPAVIIGSGDWNGAGTPAIFKMIYKGLPVYTNGITGYVGVKDVARALIRLSEVPEAAGQRFILCSDNLSYKELFDKIALAEHVKPPYREANGRLLNFMEKMIRFAGFWGIKTTITEETIDTVKHQYLYDGSKITGLTGFVYSPIDKEIEDTAHDFLDTCRSCHRKQRLSAVRR